MTTIADDRKVQHGELSDGAPRSDYDPGSDYDPSQDDYRKTSKGLYLTWISDDVEDLEQYQTGGHHPIHLGDCLGEDGETTGRYCVLLKLGHGGFSTVWLCRDTQECTYVAVKVHTADATTDKIPDLRLMELDRSFPGAEYINFPTDHFSISGPNGTHQCLVLPLLGPRVSPDLWSSLENPGPTLRSMCRQTTQAMVFLPGNGICHGDFRPSNILVNIGNVDHLSEEQLLSLLGEPMLLDVFSDDGEDLPSSAPQYLVDPTSLLLLGPEYLTDQICVIDFGESFRMQSPPADLGIPENYLPPEVLIEGDSATSAFCDLWALGCTLFEIRRQIPLFYMISGDELIVDMVGFFGKLPETWWEKWEARPKSFNEDGSWAGSLRATPMTLADYVASELERPATAETPEKRFSVPKEEQKLMEDLLLKICKYAPEDRMSAEEALEHEWLKI